MKTLSLFSILVVVLGVGLMAGFVLQREGLIEPWLAHWLPPAARTGAETKETALEHAEKHLDPQYVCPMHPQIVRDEPGSCPICGMDLVAKERPAGEASEGERKVAFYRHPHNPSVVSDHPVKDEMGMDYVPVYAAGNAESVRIAPEVVQNLGVRTAVAERGRLWKRIDTVGYVDYDQTRLVHIHLRTSGWIDKLYVRFAGERVKKGDKLFDVYSPDLVNAQEEYLQAKKMGNQRLIAASEDRLLNLGISRGQVAALAGRDRAFQTISVYAPQDGFLATMNAPEGMYVMPSSEIMALADLSQVWVQVEVFEQQVDWVRLGRPAEMRVSHLPGRVWEGDVEYIYPSLDPKTRTLGVRLRFSNPGELLKPNMYADVTLFGGAKNDIVTVPREALIRTGRSERVILALGEGRFAPRTVVAGMESGERVEIIAGIQPGDEVVVSGQFLIDSEASLSASLMRMQGAEEPSVGHGGHGGGAAAAPASGTGVLRELHPEEMKLNMEHAPIEALDWPSMTMDFDLVPGVSLEGLAAGDKVEFDLTGKQDGYRIQAIRPVAPQGGRP